MDKPRVRTLYDRARAKVDDMDAAARQAAKWLDTWLVANPDHRCIVDTAQVAILEGKNDLEALCAVKQHHADSETKLNQISQYRTALRKMGLPVLTNVEIRKERERDMLEGATL